MKCDIVGTAEIAVRLGVKRFTVYRWQQRELLPEPDYRISDVPIWDWSTIEKWAKETGRL